MKTISAYMQNHLEEVVTTLATCWRIKRRDDTEYYFTDHDEDIEFEGNTYKASSGFTRSAIETESGMSIDDLEVNGLLDDDQLKERELRLGLFDGAEFWIFMVNWANPESAIKLRRGFFGDVILDHNGQFTVELRGLTDVLHQTFIECYSPTCRADLGDHRCNVNIAAAGVSGTVLTTSGASALSGVLGDSLSSFAGGYLTFTSGDNTGATYEVASWDEGSGDVKLFMASQYPVQPGDTFNIAPGCDKTFTTCRDFFDNAVNFRGEPFLPGSDALMAYPSANTAGGEDIGEEP